MLQFAAVLTTGGLLLFTNCLQPSQRIFLALVNRIIESRNLQSEFFSDSLKVNYLYDAVLGLIFVIAWRKEIILDHPKKLLQAMSIEWKNIYERIVWKDNVILEAPDFNEAWERAFEKWVQYVNEKDREGTVMNEFAKTEAGKKLAKKKNQQEKVKQEEKVETKPQGDTTTEDPELQNLSARDRLLRAQKQKNKSRSPKQDSKKSPGKDENKAESRVWEGSKISKIEQEKLNRSKVRDPRLESEKLSKLYTEDDKKDMVGFVDSDDEVEEEKESKFLSRWVGKLKDVVGDKKITKEDLREVLKDFKQKLMEKNVAHDVAEQVSQAVGQTLLSTKTKSFTTVHKTVREAMKDALRKILTPKKKIDLVMEVIKEREKMKPYVIVFIGVNGVGKSTNLAKVAYMLKSAKLSVMLAACDNFRAGAVEQIMTHGRALDIPVFQKGYKEEPATIAFEAVRDATKKRIDAVLIDTAGRMQDNAPLMKELARLVKINKPNLVVFIGEALVGNDAVDQITKFNNSLKEESTENHAAEIDAILLSKFDTVDDKVGTALSLVYSTSKPILYVGTGQKYPNLRELNVSTVVQSLLS